MAKQKTKLVCSACGAIFFSWAGKCANCGEWNTLQQQIDIDSVDVKNSGRLLKYTPVSKVVAESADFKRLATGDRQLDTVLGGGFVKGSVTLLAGQPGIGKSTLLLQIAHELAKNYRVLYVSGEESLHQVASRAKRLGSAKAELDLSSSSSTDDIVTTIAQGDFDVTVVDSIQTVSTDAVSSAAGSVSQITNSTQLLTKAAKSTNTALIIVGHVTKEGSIAGPKVLEHSVDTVLQFEGDRYGGFKVLRSVKNRFGSTNESALYEMTDKGIVPVLNPSAALLAERKNIDGSVVFATIEGTRPVLVEIQALVNKTSYGYPKRASSGFDLNRLNLLVAMLERRTKLVLADKDIYINVVGGLKIDEPAADLAVTMAIGSAAKALRLNKNAVVFGEIGLSGEVRHVPHIENRLMEAEKMGFEIAVGPQVKKSSKNSDLLYGVADVATALNTFLS